MMSNNILARNILLFSQLKVLLLAFEEQNIAIMPVRGAAFICQSDDMLFARTMEDIDVIVKKKDLVRAMTLLTSLGYTLQKTGEYTFAKDGSPCAVDLHCDAGYLSDEDVWLAARVSAVEDVKAYFMGQEDHLIYIICHAIINHAQLRARWVKDVKTLASSRQFDWTALLKKAEIHQGLSGYEIKLALYLFFSKVNVAPEEILNSLVPVNISGRCKSMLAKKVLETNEIDDMGHLMKLLFCRGLSSFFKELGGFLLPDCEFLSRRYKLNVTIAVLLRPLLVSIKALQVFVKFAERRINMFQACL